MIEPVGQLEACYYALIRFDIATEYVAQGGAYHAIGRLKGAVYFMPGLLQFFGEQARLCAFAAAVYAFEGYE